MHRRNTVLALFFGLFTAGSVNAQSAAAPTLRLVAESGGVRTTIELQLDGRGVGGSIDEQGMRLVLDGTLAGDRLDALVRQPQTRLPLARLTGTLQRDRLDATLTPLGAGASTQLAFSRDDARDAVPQAADTNSATLDPRLTGRWVHQSMISSSGGAGGYASFSTERSVEFSADGRVQQWVRSVGGGGTWSAQGGRKLEFNGRWQARAGEIWVQPQGQDHFQRAAQYRFSGAYLVTQDGAGRKIWQR